MTIHTIHCRDNFDKEVQDDKKSGRPKKKPSSERNKREAQAIYRPPVRGSASQSKSNQSSDSVPHNTSSSKSKNSLKNESPVSNTSTKSKCTVVNVVLDVLLRVLKIMNHAI